MKLNNSIKLAIANFALFWKLLLYKIVALGLGCIFLLPILNILKNTFTASGLIDVIKEFFIAPAFQSVTKITNQVLSVFQTFFAGIVDLANNNVFALIYLAIIIMIVIPFLFKLSDVPASEVVYSYMSSLNKNSFTINYINMFGKSASYSILRTIFEIIFWTVLFSGTYGLLLLGTLSDLMSILSPLLLFIFIVFLFALNSSFYNGWAPSIVVFNCCALKGFKKGIKAIKRNFFSILSSFTVCMTVFVCLTYIFGIYGLFLIIPLSALILSVFGQVLFFESQGMNYYLSPDKIISPRKLECADKIKQVKNII